VPPGARRRPWPLIEPTVPPVPGEIHVFSIVIAFGAVTLVATGFLFVAQMFEDFRHA
jgi:hypothetical protein